MTQIEISKSELPGKNMFKYFDYPEYKIEFLIYVSSESKILIYSSFCPHFGGKLSVKDNSLFCHFHGYNFELNSGKCVNRINGLVAKKFDFFEDIDSILISLD
jgi:nitrite reductase/ring-hydroxylating ferredoxin subunit